MINIHDERVTEKFQSKVNGRIASGWVLSYGEALQVGLEEAERFLDSPLGQQAREAVVTVEKVVVVTR